MKKLLVVLCRPKDDAPGYKVIGCNTAGHILVSGAFPRHPRAIRSTLREVRRALSQWKGLSSSGIAEVKLAVIQILDIADYKQEAVLCRENSVRRRKRPGGFSEKSTAAADQHRFRFTKTPKAGESIRKMNRKFAQAMRRIGRELCRRRDVFLLAHGTDNSRRFLNETPDVNRPCCRCVCHPTDINRGRDAFGSDGPFNDITRGPGRHFGQTWWSRPPLWMDPQPRTPPRIYSWPTSRLALRQRLHQRWRGRCCVCCSPQASPQMEGGTKSQTPQLFFAQGTPEQQAAATKTRWFAVRTGSKRRFRKRSRSSGPRNERLFRGFRVRVGARAINACEPCWGTDNQGERIASQSGKI
jgi:hypothetical protein